MGLKVAGVEWDKGNVAKCQKHGLKLSDIEHVLLKNLMLVVPDRAHSLKEVRFGAVGKTIKGRYALVIVTLRSYGDQVRLRPLSARYMHRKERERYEKEISRL